MIAGARLASTDPLIRWDWVWGHLHDIWTLTVEHVELALIAVVVGLAISLPVAIWAHRHRRAYAPITWTAGILYTIPSLALFSLLVPVTGLSVLTVEIGLVSYTLLILIRNIVAGLDEVPSDAKDAARGMGFTRRQLLFRVELPLALPVIFAGLRIATVSTIALVTIGALIGRGGLGQLILEGLRLLFTTEIVVGAVLSVVLALAADGLLLLMQRALTPWARAGRSG